MARPALFLCASFLVACGSDSASSPAPEPLFEPDPMPFANGVHAGNLAGRCLVPADALPDTLAPDHVVGTGTPASCTAEALRQAVALGGRIAFACGPDSVRIVLDAPLKIVNDAASEVVIDGGGKVTLSGGGTSRILYMNTCDQAQHWTTNHCQDQDHPRLTVQNLTFVDGNSEGETEFDGGGAIWTRGGRLRIVNCRFFRNVCARSGADVGGGAVRTFDQSGDKPVHVLASTFGAVGEGNVGSNGGALSSIGVGWSIWNSEFAGNEAVGNGGNPASEGTPGGGSGGAIYNDGNTMTLSLCGSTIQDNRANAFGAAIFFVSNDRSGFLRLTDSRIAGNHGGGWHVLPGISMHPETRREISNTILEEGD